MVPGEAEPLQTEKNVIASLNAGDPCIVKGFLCLPKLLSPSSVSGPMEDLAVEESQETMLNDVDDCDDDVAAMMMKSSPSKIR